MVGVEGEQRVEVDVSHAVGVGDADRLAVDRRRGSAQTAARRRVLPGVETPDLGTPGPALAADERLDLLATMPGQQQKPPEALGQVDPDHVPHDRLPADLHERLGHRRRVLLQARSPASAEDDHDRPHAGDYP